MTKKEYLKKCGVTSVQGLTDKQVLSFFMMGYAGIESEVAASYAINGGFGLNPINKEKAYKLMRKAIEEEGVLRCQFVNGEGIAEDDSRPSTSHWVFSVTKQ